MRIISCFGIGWFLIDGLSLMCGGQLKSYPVWVPIIGLVIIAAITEIRSILKD